MSDEVPRHRVFAAGLGIFAVSYLGLGLVRQPGGGSVIELRGDEALAVFISARQAILAATHAQARFLEETLADPTLALPVGIGLDAGEAVPVEGGYRGGALNLAARLCGQAAAGEILASQGVIHLARKVEGVRTHDRGELHLKNLTDPVHVFRLISEEDDPAVRFREFAPARKSLGPAPVRLARAHPIIAIVIVLLLIAAVAVPAGLALEGGGASGAIVGDALAMIDLHSGKLTGSVPLASRPGDVAVGDGSVWVTLPDRGAVQQIDPATMTIQDTIPVGADPAGIAVGDNSVWVTNGGNSTVSRISPDTNSIVDTITVPGGPAGIAIDQHGVWVADSFDASVSQIDPESGTVKTTIPVGDHPVDVAADGNGIWVANAVSGSVSLIDPVRGVEVATFDGPGRAVHLRASVRQFGDPTGIQVRASIHTGEPLEEALGVRLALQRLLAPSMHERTVGARDGRLAAAHVDLLTTDRAESEFGHAWSVRQDTPPADGVAIRGGGQRRATFVA